MNTGEGHYTCSCLPGFAGENCDLEVRECDSKPCHNGGRCVDLETGYSCICPNGFEGPHCEHRILTCADRPCFQGGNCRERDNGRSYICECPAGYTGLNCEKKVDKCTSLQCANGFSGLRCEINIDECSRNPCANGSTCVDRINDYTCICPPEYMGRRCDRPVNRCSSLRCLNGGTCTYVPTGKPTCICSAPYSGSQCQNSDKLSANTTSPNTSLEPSEKLNLVAVGLGVGLVTVLVFICMAVVVVRNRKKQKDKELDSKTMNNLSRSDFHKENLISSVELKNTNKKIGLEVDCPTEKSNHNYINSYQLDYKSSMRYKEELSLLSKDENCEKTLEDRKHLSRMYSDCRISTICSSKESVYQSVFVIGEEKQECIIATEPGRVVTLVEDQEASTWGVAYEVPESHMEESLQYLNTREVMLGGYTTKMVEFVPKEKSHGPVLALVYIATSDNPIYLGPASDVEIADQISISSGKTGHNIEYLLRLAEFMRLCCPEVEDEHLFSIEAAVLKIFPRGEITPSPKTSL
ncbi:hypothetical protein GOODEAATRI_001440 [Goodea atripinnis]|uniref:EGF-like domain-containing protein n=1 Tax=Goodea atripinnis TaxID=208336 RepID=A0ABV0PJX7_9TELE